MNNSDQIKKLLEVTSAARLVCQGLREFLGRARPSLPSELKDGDVIYDTMEHVLSYIEQGIVDGLNKTISITLTHEDAKAVRVNVLSVIHTTPSEICAALEVAPHGQC